MEKEKEEMEEKGEEKVEEEEGVEKEEEATSKVSVKASSRWIQKASVLSRSPSPVQRFGLADISNGTQHTNSFQTVEELKQTVCVLRERLAEMEKRSAQYTPPPFSSWSSPILPFGNFPPLNPWAYTMPAMTPFTPPHMLASPNFETPRSSISEAEYSDDIEFDEVFANYGSDSPLKIRPEVAMDCWRKACCLDYTTYCMPSKVAVHW